MTIIPNIRLSRGQAAKGPLIPASFFGMHINNLTPTSIYAAYDPSAPYTQTPFPAIGVKNQRTQDAQGCSWRNIERTNGVYTWSFLDYYIASMKSNGVKQPIFMLCYPPDWASAPNYGQTYYTQAGNPIGEYVGYNPWPPANNADWTNWCTALATRVFSEWGPGAAYEPWNEVYDNTYGASAVGSGYAGSLSGLITLCQLARSAILAVDPTALILSPSFSSSGIINYNAGNITLDQFIAAGGMAYCDVVNLHGYVSSAAPGVTPSGPNYYRPEGFLSFMANVNALLSVNNITKPIWITEWGFGTWSDSSATVRAGPGGTATPDPMSSQQAADYLIRMLILTWCSGCSLFCFYAFDAFNFSSQLLVSASDSTTLLPASTALVYFQNLLIGGQLSGLSRQFVGNTGYYSANFRAGSGRTGVTYWCDDNATCVVSIAGAKQITNDLGINQTLSASITITGSPQFVFFT